MNNRFSETPEEADKMHRVLKKDQILTIPNLLSVVRLDPADCVALYVAMVVSENPS